ncbi:MAG: hypothetical protein SGJ01_17700 [Gemmatimonadota bacterium]|nr:hypothetical protein [Gemmatimonadota bacterium]
MGETIRQKADRVGTFRFISVHLMETLARWIPTTPELEAKVFFGRQVWDFAQHADWLGRRTGELRSPMQWSLQPADGYLKVLEAMASATGTMERLTGFHDGLLPDLAARYRSYISSTDPLNDEPTVRILERILFDFQRLQADRAAFPAVRPDLILTDTAWPGRIATLSGAETDYVSSRAAVRTAVTTA